MAPLPAGAPAPSPPKRLPFALFGAPGLGLNFNSSWVTLEHGITILAPVFRKQDKSQETKTATEEEVRPNPIRFRQVHVFDIGQTDGTPLPEPPSRRLEGESGEARWLIARLLELAKAEGLTVDMAAQDCGSANGFYSRQSKIIHVADGLAVNQQAKTLAHEIGHHVLGHEGGHGDRSAKEVAAEGTAFVVCQHYGMDTTAYSLGYVATWAGGGKEGEQKVRATLREIQHAGGAIIDRVEELERRRETENLVGGHHFCGSIMEFATITRILRDEWKSSSTGLTTPVKVASG